MHIVPYSIRMRENEEQNNSNYDTFHALFAYNLLQLIFLLKALIDLEERSDQYIVKD